MIAQGLFNRGKEPLNSPKPGMGTLFKNYQGRPSIGSGSPQNTILKLAPTGNQGNANSNNNPPKQGSTGISGLASGIVSSLGLEHLIQGFSGGPAAAGGSAPSAPVVMDLLYDGAPANVTPVAAAPGALATYAPPAAAVVAAGAGTAMGLHDAYDKWTKGGGNHPQENAIVQGSNAIMSPATGFIGRLPGGLKPNNTVQDVIGLSNPVTAPVALADLAGIHFGHSGNYYQGKDRENFINKNSEDGQIGGVTAEQFRKDPTTYNYDQSSPTHDTDIGAGQALAYLKTGAKPGEKPFTDTTGLYANLHKNGMPTEDEFSEAGYNHDSAYGQIHQDYLDGKLDKNTADILKNGLDQAFGVGAYGSGEMQFQSSGGGGGGHNKPKTAPPVNGPTIADIVPQSSQPPIMPQPDDEPSPQETNTVNNYQNVLDNMLKRTRLKNVGYTL